MSDAALILSPALLGTEDKRTRAYELKFVLSESQACDVERWAASHLLPDPYGEPDLGNAYRVTSLYLDTPGLDVFHRVRPHRRRKLRLRGYGASPLLYLEQKLRRGNRVRKWRTPAHSGDLQRLGVREIDSSWSGAWFHQRLLEANLRPTYQCGCLRSAYLGTAPEGPVRLTLDRQLHSFPNGEWCLLPGQGGMPLLDGQVALELKFCAALPALFKRLLEEMTLAPGPLSKYRLAVRAWNPGFAIPQVGLMPEWFTSTLSAKPLPWQAMLICLFTAALLGAVTALVYAFTRRGEPTNSPNFPATLVLLSILIAAVTLVIGDNAARAFSLVGALAIVRFRTVVDDTRDVAFVMLSVVVGMAVGAAHAELAVATLGVATFAAVIMRPRRLVPAPAAETWTMTVRIGIGHEASAALRDVCDRHLATSQLLGAGTARQGSAVEMTWSVGLRPETSAAVLVADLNKVEGVQNVELRRA